MCCFAHDMSFPNTNLKWNISMLSGLMYYALANRTTVEFGQVLLNISADKLVILYAFAYMLLTRLLMG